jgi:4-hydroxy-3-polyprenylbenzoate decarboxylase
MNSDQALPITVAVSGASGALYALRTLRALGLAGRRVELIVSPYGQMLLRDEADLASSADLEAWLESETGRPAAEWIVRHGYNDQSATISSGSHRSAGMVVVPCSVKTLSAVALGGASTLIERAADVTLKERRPLILVLREAPFSRVHMENMLRAHDAGAVILPASPAFYQGPESFDDLGDFIAGRVLNLLGIPQELFPSWEGRGSS